MNLKSFSDALVRRVMPLEAPYAEPVADHIGTKHKRVMGIYDTYQIPRCVVWPHYSVAKKLALVSETLMVPNRTEFVYPHLFKYPVKRAPRRRVVCIGDMWHNYYHRYVDHIPKLYNLKHWIGKEEGADVALLVSMRYTEHDLNLLRRMVPEGVLIEQVSPYVRYQCQAYIHLPRLSARADRLGKNSSALGYLPAEYVHYFRDLVLGDRVGKRVPGRKIYVSRRNAARRRILNDAGLEAMLAKRGFDLVTLGPQPIEEQARLFAEADVIVAQHGAALTNLLYASPGAKVVEIFSYAGHDEVHYRTICPMLDLEYRRADLTPDGEGNRNSDGTLDLDAFGRMLDELGA
jgi:capsular polysaccharide biosynthesis protein